MIRLTGPSATRRLLTLKDHKALAAGRPLLLHYAAEHLAPAGGRCIQGAECNPES